MAPRDFAAYVFLALAWGMSFLLLLHVVEAFGWIGAVTLRSLVTAVTLFLIAIAARRKLAFSASWRAFAVVGATTVAGQLIGLSYATPLVGTAMAAILVATIPLFSMLISQVWGLERLTKQGFAGLIIGFSGILLLVGFPAVPVTTGFIIGCAAALAACICAAYGSNYASRYLKGVGSWEITIGSFLTGGLMTLPLLLAVPLPRAPRLIDYGYLLVQAVVMSGLTYITYFKLVSSIGATRAISVEFAVTVVAVLVGALVLDEPLSLPQLFGAGIIILGCALVLDLMPRKKAPPTPSGA
ncbi:DMT family transporter [Agrobacterium tumefaciens]|uniref:Permease n=1 Tax=Agrobacterium tumefaciens TaxID=358 RepID=A0A2L2LH39_AGRTU|nr:DMT family transporter [Agrobacterium tumefaciens]AVH43558.1 permease [Agrobacterium tumefaciens]NSY97505.1 DMT family transporter [Agrobacterium tumefaciens]NSZ03396.1 DMT family transporter [Agrobacterium tumefaciens]NSZ37644.1 DMT family transporter [Agrobacterium tumefaciens]NTB04000.1 DMT family transporter [Agrobacterium tumefaciens]